MTSERKRNRAAALYLAVAIMTFGAAWHSVQSPRGLCFSEEAPKSASCASMMAAPVAAALWPLYWSVRFWS